VASAVIGLGLWWIWRQPPQGPQVLLNSKTEQIDTDVPSIPEMPAPNTSALGKAESLIRGRQAAEVVFENAPKDGQAWDMSASVRGIKGGVQAKINQFQSQ